MQRLQPRLPLPGEGSLPTGFSCPLIYFSAEGRVLYLLSQGGVLARVNLAADDRRSVQLAADAAVRCSEESDGRGGSRLLDADELAARWQIVQRSATRSQSTSALVEDGRPVDAHH
jgi:hypothetical protein